MDMINDKKIEEAANLCRFEVIASMHNPYQCFEEEVDAQSDLIEDSFISGAKWAINEFLNGLWHHADEEPKKNRLVLTDTQSIIDKCRICWLTVKLTENGFVRNWSNYAKVTKITRWLYIDDLFPKEGGNHD